jgi:hypothetical protein
MLAYAAGIVDGEGYIGISKFKAASNNYIYQVQLEMGMCDKEAIDFIAKTFDYHITIAKRNKYHKKNIYRIRLTANQAVSFLKRIYPFLIVKKKQANLCFILWELIHSEESKSKTDLRNLTPKTILQRELLYKKIRVLNG